MPQQCHSSKFVIFQENFLKVLKCYNLRRLQRRHNCCPAASLTNCVMTLYLLKLHLPTFLCTPITQKCQIMSRDNLFANERCVNLLCTSNTSCRLRSPFVAICRNACYEGYVALLNFQIAPRFTLLISILWLQEEGGTQIRTCE